jgi:hypothetical protein
VDDNAASNPPVEQEEGKKIAISSAFAVVPTLSPAKALFS